MTPTEALAVARAALGEIREEYRPYSIANDTADEALRAIANVDAEPVPTEALLRKAFDAGMDCATSRCIGGAPKFDEWFAGLDLSALPEPVATEITDDPATWPIGRVFVWDLFGKWTYHTLSNPCLLRPQSHFTHWMPAPPDPTRKEANDDQPTD